jgi:hypothetical protein
MSSLRRARDLGIEHGLANVRPFGGPADPDESAIMTALGHTSRTTARSQGRRVALLDAYLDGLESGEAVAAMCRTGTTEGTS